MQITMQTTRKKNRGTEKNVKKKREICRYMVIGVFGILGMGGLPACRILGSEKSKVQSFRTEICDSLREREKMEWGKRASVESLRQETIRWREIGLSPPDSAGRQYIRRVRTASTCTIGKTVVEDTLTVRSFRENRQVRRSSENAARRQETKPPVGWRTGWIGMGLILLFLCLLSRFGKS